MPEGEVSQELKKISSLLALQAIAGKPKGESAAILSVCGFSNKDIALLISTTEASVRAHISNASTRTKTKDELSK